LQRLNLVQIDEELLDFAAIIDPRVLRSFDAIHLAAAQLFGDELTPIVTYDRRMAAAAGLLGLPSPHLGDLPGACGGGKPGGPSGWRGAG
jgi:predicted nucleic acid-binding protein